VKRLVLDAALMTGQRLEGAIGIVEASIIRGHRIGGYPIDPG
jgi:hypothetical protein